MSDDLKPFTNIADLIAEQEELKPRCEPRVIRGREYWVNRLSVNQYGMIRLKMARDKQGRPSDDEAVNQELRRAWRLHLGFRVNEESVVPRLSLQDASKLLNSPAASDLVLDLENAIAEVNAYQAGLVNPTADASPTTEASLRSIPSFESPAASP